MPEPAEMCSPAETLVAHWATVNEYLLEFVDRHPERAAVAIANRLEDKVERIAQYLGVTIHDREALRACLARRPNAAPTEAQPGGLGEVDEGRWKHVWGNALTRATF
jgi:hypothetical protein